VLSSKILWTRYVNIIGQKAKKVKYYKPLDLITVATTYDLKKGNSLFVHEYSMQES
jgi:hypothetical protein